jgi:topoisomerase-4 subunit A
VGLRFRPNGSQEKNDIIINALPYQASGSKILEQIADQMLKKKIPMVVDLADEGDHEEPVRLVITLKSNRVNAEDVMNHLFASTDLQKNYRANMNLISLAGGPRVFDLLSLLKEWITFRKNTVIRRLEHRLDQVNDRLHILEGLLAVYLNIDEVIKIIRESDEPKKEIIREFKLTDIQANAILEIKLRQLAKLEQIKLEDERSKLSDEQKEIETILSSKARLKTLIKKELLEIKENFGEERRSPIKNASNAKVFSEEETLVTEPITVVLSEAGWIRSGKGHEIDPSSLSYRGEDKLQDYARGKSNQTAVFIDSSGKVFSIASHSLPSARGMGEPISGRVNAESGVNFISALIGEPDDKFIFTNTAGYGYISEFSNTISNKKTGKAFMKIPEGASLIKSQKLREDHQYIAAVSSIGKLLIFRLDELPILPKGKGNKIINIPTAKFKSKEEKMLDIQLLAEDSNLVVHYGTKTRSLPFKDWQHYISSRAKRGNILAGHLKRVESISEEVKVKDSAKESS